MKPFHVSRFLALVRDFQELVSQKSGHGQDITEEDRLGSQRFMSSYSGECERLGLVSTADQFERMRLTWRTAKRYSEVNALVPELLNRLEDECKRKVVMSFESRYVEYFTNAQLFDSKDTGVAKVSVQFPSASEDIAESGKCLACSRPTACVMHLNRIMEVGLRALAAAVGVGRKNDWGKYLTDIEGELTKRMKAARARSLDEQFYAEAHAMFDSVRRAWRNPNFGACLHATLSNEAT
jgi:hypothetical protein